MKRIIIVVVSGLCCALCMAQTLDTAKIKSEWPSIVAVCCAQQEVDFLSSCPQDDKLSAGIQKLNNGLNDPKKLHWGYIKNVNKDIQSQKIKTIELYYDTLNNVPDTVKIKSWEKLFPAETIDEKYNTKTTSEKLKKQLEDQYAQKSKKNESPIQETSSSLSTIDIVLLVIVLFLLSAIVYGLIRIYLEKEEIEKIKEQLEGLREYSKTNISVSYDQSITEKLTKIYGSRLDLLEKRMDSLKIIEVSNTQTSAPKVQSNERQPLANREPVNPVNNSILVYLKNFNEGVMKECSQKEAQYALTLSNTQATSGEFEFIGNIDSALATKDATFDYVCELENWSMSATTIGKGKVDKISEGKWRVTQKGKVKFS